MARPILMSRCPGSSMAGAPGGSTSRRSPPTAPTLPGSTRRSTGCAMATVAAPWSSPSPATPTVISAPDTVKPMSGHDDGRISRRSLLLGAAGTAVLVGGGLGAAGYEVRRHPSLRTRLFGCGSSPATPPSDYSFDAASLASVAMGGASVPWSIALPNQGRVTGLPLVVALPGTDGNASNYFTTLGLPGFATAAGLRACFVSVGDVDSSYYHPRSDGTDLFSFIVDELIPLVEARYGVGG